MNKKVLSILVISLIFISGCNSLSSEKKNENSGKSYPDNAYYIDNNLGDDGNPGTFKKPLKTIAGLNTRLKKRFAAIYFAGGQTFSGTLLLKDINGTEKEPVVISSWGTGKAIINGGNNEAVIVENCWHLFINNLNVAGNGRKGGNTSNGLSLVRSGRIKIENINAEGFQKSGVDLYDCSETEVRKVYAFENGFSGINVMGSSRNLSRKITIQDCQAENNPGDPTNLNNHSGNGILVGVSDSVIIDHCSATNNGWDMPRQGNGPVGIWAWESDHITIQYCISYRNKTSENAKDGGGFDLDGGVSNSIIQYCLSYENQGAGYGLFQYSGASNWSNNIIRYCISINDAQTTEGAGSFFIWNGSGLGDQLTNCQIYNNIAYNTLAPVISFENASAHNNFMFSNNIFLFTGQAFMGKNSGSSFLGNVWWNTKGKAEFMENRSLSEWAEKTGQEKSDGKLIGICSDPMFKGPLITNITDPYKLGTLDGYTLNENSPIINRGIVLKGLLNEGEKIKDFYGNPVYQGERPEPGIQEIR